MSPGALLMVIFIAILVIKPEDIPVILKKIQAFRIYFTNLKTEVISCYAKEFKTQAEPVIKDVDEINFYLQRIIELQGHYEGEYSTAPLKAKYQELIEKEVKNASFSKENN